VADLDEKIANRRPRPGQLVIVDEASLAGTFTLDELVSAARHAGAKVLLVGDWAQLSAVDAGGMFRALVHDRDGHAPELSDVRRFQHRWEKTASVELRLGRDAALDAYETHGRISGGSRDEMLDALYGAWRADQQEGKQSLMIAGDLDTVRALNARARADRIHAGDVAVDGLIVAGQVTAGVGDLVVTRENNRLLTTNRGWVKNGDRWIVTATHQDGSMAVRRASGRGEVVLPATYVGEHVELGYATTAHRAQGRTSDTAHALISAATDREVLYVAATRGRQANRLYVDTCYDPDPSTSHDKTAERLTAREVLAAVLRNEGADVAAHEMIRRSYHDAESLVRLAAEYNTIARAAQEHRWDALLERSGLNASELEAVRASEAHGPLLAAFRDAESRGLDIDVAFPRLATGRSLDGADDPAAVLHSRVDRWMAGAASRRQSNLHHICGLIPKAQGVTDPDLRQALNDREQAMELRARALAETAIKRQPNWVRLLGTPPENPDRRERWIHRVATVAAYRERWSIDDNRSILGGQQTIKSTEQLGHHKRAQSAIGSALAISRSEAQPSTGRRPDMAAGTEQPLRPEI
jgi:hypothetical protein